MNILISRLLNNANSKPFSSLLRKIKAESNLRDKARLNSVSARQSGAWLVVIHNQKLGLVMSPQEFMVALRMWLGIPMFPSPPSSIRCPCDTVIDPDGDDVLGCGHGSLRNKRYDTLCDVIFNTVLVDNRDCKKKQRCNSHNNARLGAAFHPDFLQGRVAYFDVTARNSLQASYLLESATQPGAAAAGGNSQKTAWYEDEVNTAGCDFYPLVVETLGVWSPSSLEILKIIARRTVLPTGATVSKAIQHLLQQLSSSLWRYNAKLILSRLAICNVDNVMWEYV
ncbi:uncharacterized protein LOC134186939 [Corticium candelabrum]|uniref:uncharacterized protein LOC134186939 n=1 Tax=Corticium candelabrum TaxID=121492 RepID=UPI002E27434A|nr:uncharacterized protein LOC134186939 [Corticium candelabrum]